MFRKLITYYKPHRKLLIFVLSMVIVGAIAELTLPIFTRLILNEYLPNENIQAIVKLIMVMTILTLIYSLAAYASAYYGHLLGVAIEKDMRMNAFNKIQQLPFKYYDQNKTGIIMARLTADLHEVSELAHHGIEEIVSVAFMMIVGYVLLIQMNFWVTSILFVLVLVMVALLIYARNDRNKAFRKLRREHGELNSKLESSISGIRLTRAFSNEQYEIDRFNSDNDIYIQSYKGAYKALGITNAVNSLFVQLVGLAVIIAGTYLVLGQTFSAGDMFAYYIYFNLLMNPIKRIMTMMETFQQGAAGFERYLELMNEPVLIESHEDAYKLKPIKGDIEFKDVSFSYNDNKGNVLESFNLTIPSGQMIALVGPSGVGKTTITQLIPRFYDINEGNIFIDGYDLKDLDLKTLREQIGYIQQDVVIFWGSIKDNIAYGKPSASDEEIVEAAKKAGLHEFILSLPKGYNTMVGERGVMLSGGQKQRISISRIFLRDPKILILDEATSALDNITEKYIQQSLEELSKNRTVVVIAHRLSTVQKANNIIVLGKNGISEMGTHEELLNQNGHYKNLYEASQNNYLPDELDSF